MKRRELLKQIRKVGDINSCLMFSDKRKDHQRVKYWHASGDVTAVQDWLKNNGHGAVTAAHHYNDRGVASIIVYIPHKLYN